MKRLLNTLFITKDDAGIKKDGESLVIEQHGQVLLRTPVHILSGIVCLGRVYVSPQAMEHCAQNGVTISFLSSNGRFWGRVQGPVSGSVLLRRRQYECSGDVCAASAVARSVVAAKIANCKTVLQRGARASFRNSEGATRLRQASAGLTAVLRRLETEDSLDGLRGTRGRGRSSIFRSLRQFDSAPKRQLFLYQTQPQTPSGPDQRHAVICLYSFGA